MRWTAERHPPTCNDCHEQHAARSAKQAADNCPKCHHEEYEAFELGPHAGALEARGFLPCADCHGSHDVVAASPALIGLERGQACEKCHRDEQDIAAQIHRIGGLVASAEATIDRAKAAVEARAGAGAGRTEVTFRELREAQRSLRLAVHRLDMEALDAASQNATRLAAQVGAAEAAPARSVADDAGVSVLRSVLGVFLGFVILLLLHQAWRRRKRGTASNA